MVVGRGIGVGINSVNIKVPVAAKAAHEKPAGPPIGALETVLSRSACLGDPLIMRHDRATAAGIGAVVLSLGGCFQTSTLLDEDGGVLEGGTGLPDGSVAAACDGVEPEALLSETCGLSGCHTGDGDLFDVNSPGLAERLPRLTARVFCIGRPLIGYDSYLIEKISGTPRCGSRMPLVGGLSTRQIDCISQYVRSLGPAVGSDPWDGGMGSEPWDGGTVSDAAAPCNSEAPFTEQDWLLSPDEADDFGLTGPACAACHTDRSGQFALFPSCRPPDPPRMPAYPEPTHPIFRALRCSMDAGTAIRALVRSVACDGEPDAHITALVSAWEEGLLGNYSLAATDGSIPGLPGRSCETWQCVAEALSCEDVRQCDARSPSLGLCSGADGLCQGTELHVCDGSQFVRAFDCAVAGGTCDPAAGACTVPGPDCAFGPSDPSSCAGGDIALCPGFEVSCLEWAAGHVCAPLTTPGGLIPTCAPTSQARAIDPALAAECRGGRIRFTSERGTALSFDCVANGYSGCNSRGCLP